MRYARVLAAVSLLSVAGTAMSAEPIQFVSGTTTIAKQNAESLRAAATAARGSRVLVQFGGPLDAAAKRRLRGAGVELLSSVGSNAWYVNMAADGDAGATLEAVGAHAVRSIDRKWKMHPSIAAKDYPAFSVVRVPVAGDDGAPVIGVYVMLHKDVAMDRGAALIAGLGGEVRDRLESINALVVEIPVDKIDAVVDSGEVMWVEPPMARMGPFNAENRALVQADAVQAAPYNLNGQGVRVLVYDAGSVLSTHQDFVTLQGTNRVHVGDGASVSFHPTHVAGTIGGDGGQSSGASLRGMAPNVRFESYTFEYDGSGVFLYTNPGDIEADYTEAFVTNGADISNNSIGTNVAPNGFPCSYEGDYGVTPAVIDALVRGETLGFPIRIVWSAGNERGNGGCGTQFATVPPPATNKNACVVGAVDSDTDLSTSFSSWGPTDDGRLKPDVTAPGCQINGDGGVTSTWSDGGYGTICGTSMSGPTVTGCAALMLQDFRVQFPGRPDFRNSTLKTLLAHTAADVGNPGPDYKHGYGSVRVKDAIDFMRTGNFIESEVDQGGVYTVFVDVPPGGNFKATLAWDDFAGNPAVTNTLVNDLDLAVFDPNNLRRHPFTLNPSSPNANAVSNQEDHVNNMEQVFVQGAQAGTWRIEVRGTTVPEGPQSFSLAAGPNLVAMSLSPVASIPSLVAPGSPFDVDLQVNTLNQAVVGGSVKMFFRTSGGSFTQVAMSDQGGGVYRATVPGLNCADVPELYFEAAGAVTGVARAPAGAPASTYGFDVGTSMVNFEDDAETNMGWSLGVAGDTATTGVWVRAEPVGTDAQPELDHSDPGTLCFVTGNGAVGGGVGDNDVDGGLTTLRSPTFDLSGVDSATISYWRWYSNSAGAAPGADTFRVDISNNNGSTWTNAETVGPTGPGTNGGWVFASFDPAAFVPLTDQMRVRFVAEDAASGSIVEAAIDDFRIDTADCVDVTPSCPGDVNNSGAIDVDDLNAILAAFGNNVGIGSPIDIANNDGVIDVDDLNVILASFGASCP